MEKAVDNAMTAKAQEQKRVQRQQTQPIAHPDDSTNLEMENVTNIDQETISELPIHTGN